MSMTTFAALAGALAILQLLSFLLAVLKLRSNSTVTVPRAAVVDPARLEPSWLECARPTLERLGELGFVHRAYLDGLSPAPATIGWQRGRMATQAHRTLAELGIDPGAPVMPNGPGTPMSSDGTSSAAA